jgi:transcriptional regulator with GAF, ATPase, and Fis domain
MTHDPTSQPDSDPTIDLAVDSETQARPESDVETPPREYPSRFDKQDSESSRGSSGDEVDSQLVDQTKNQIRSLVQEIAELAKSDCSVDDFYEGFLTRTTSALASIGGAVWIRESADEPLKLHYHINLKKTKLGKDKKAQVRHGRLLKKLADNGEPTLIGPDSGSAGDDLPGNPTEYLLIVGPLKIDNVTVGLVEIFQRPGAGPTTQRGYLRFLMQMCEIASDFLRNQRIRSFAQQQAMWQQLEQFIRIVHQGLDTEQTVYSIANEGRRLIDCDRASVAIGTGRQCRIKAVSGLDSIERRAEQVKKLGTLAATVIRAGQPLWYTGEDADLPPQIEKKLHDYVDKSHTKMLAIIPLVETVPDSEDPKQTNSTKPKPLGALIVEQLTDSRVTPSLEKRTEIVVEHGQAALTNAAEHNSIFLMPVWKTIGKLTSAFRVGNRAKTLAVLAVTGAALAFLALFPYSFGLGAKGSLIPERQHEVFAKVDGTMEAIFVSDDGDTIVQLGQPLAQMKNSDIELAIDQINGEIAIQEAEKILNLQLQNRSGLNQFELVEVTNKIALANKTIEFLNKELQIRLLEQQRLVVTSPADGRVINWNARQNLMHRPVTRGQNLMTVVDPNTKWLIELEMPERRLAHLIEAKRKSDKPLKVTFGLVSNPGTEYVGELLDIDEKLDVYSDEGNSALVRVAFPNDSIVPQLLKSETRVTAKVQCGTRSIGYVIFHEMFETVQSSLMFWF